MPRNRTGYVPSTELLLNYPFPKVQYTQPNGNRCQFSDVPKRIKFAFRDFEFKNWEGFEKKAAKVLVGTNEKPIDDYTAALCKVLSLRSGTGTPTGEDELRADFRGYVFDALNGMTSPTKKWGFGQPQKLPCEPSSRTPDLSFGSQNVGSSSSQTRDNVNIPIVNGEVKVPTCLHLGDRLTADVLKTSFRASDFLDRKELNPFFQALSYGLYTSKGLCFLTNYEKIRFFQILIGSKEVLMSPVVKIDQVLDITHNVPHAAQTLLYMDEVENPKADEFSSKLANDLLIKGDKRADEHDKKMRKEKEKKEKENARSSKGSSSKHKGSSSGGDKKGGKHADLGSGEIYTPVSRVLRQCKVMGSVGVGVTGELTECDFNGVKVVVKTGQKMSYRDERDCFFHVKHESKMYKVLEKLQGRVIPRMVIAGLETYFTPSAMVLITEKVGMCVEEYDDGKIYVDGRVLDEENLMLLEEKGLEGLRTLHDHSVVHYDSGARNTRVEMRDGKIDRVWWVDLGDACEIDEEAEKVWDVEGYRGNYPKGVAIDLDIGVFRRSIREALEAIES